MLWIMYAFFFASCSLCVDPFFSFVGRFCRMQPNTWKNKSSYLSVPVLLSTAIVVQCRLINLCWNIRISPSAVECHDFSFSFFDFLFIITSTCCHNHGGLTVFGWQRKWQQHNRGKKKMTWSFWSPRLWMKWIFHWESEERHFCFCLGSRTYIRSGFGHCQSSNSSAWIGYVWANRLCNDRF